jgi:hypothetical protein
MTTAFQAERQNWAVGSCVRSVRVAVPGSEPMSGPARSPLSGYPALAASESTSRQRSGLAKSDSVKADIFSGIFERLVPGGAPITCLLVSETDNTAETDSAEFCFG